MNDNENKKNATYGEKYVPARDDTDGFKFQNWVRKTKWIRDPSRGKPSTHANGRMMAHELPGICHPGGIRGVDKMTMAAIARPESKNANQNRLKMRGTSIQKFDRSTSCDSC